MAIQKVFSILVVLALVGNIYGSTVFRKERSIESSHRQNREAEEESICEYRTPCGWAVYKRFTRQIDFFMKNSCKCPEGKKCVQDDDDISVSAYVYRCVELTPEEIEKEKEKKEAEKQEKERKDKEKEKKEADKQEKERKDEEETSRTR